VAHPSAVQECGFSDPRFTLSRWPIPICPFFARGVFRMEEKAAPFTKAMKGATPEVPLPPQEDDYDLPVDFGK
jgi:hypothetical protein